MRDVWQRIEAVLQAQAPDLYARLPAGASTEAIAAIEARLGFALPEDVREAYAIHDGSGRAGILPQDDSGRVNGVRMLALEDVLFEWQSWVELLNGGEFKGNKAAPKGPVKAEWWSPRWMPVTGNGAGDHLCIDMDPASGGTAGQVIDFSHESGPRLAIAPSLRAFLVGHASDLEAGRLRFDASGELVAAADA